VIAGCVTSKDAKEFERRLSRLEREVNSLRREVSEAKGEVSSAVGKVKALEENYRFLLNELKRIKGKRGRK